MQKILNKALTVKAEESTLANLTQAIKLERTQILSTWIKHIKLLRGSYTNVNYSELSDLCSEFLEAFGEMLKNSKFLKLRIFIEKICRIRSAQGFRLSEVQRAYYSFYDILKPIIEQSNTKGEHITEALETINRILIDTLFELSESYHKRLNEKIDNYVDDIEKINLKLKETSIKDELTGCYNYRYFHDILDSELSRAIRYKRPLSISIFDIDYFKKINDTYGHLSGDTVLRDIGDIFRKNIRPSDMPFRYGGEELSIIFPETTSDRALLNAERIRKKIADTRFSIKGKAIKLTVSAGVEGCYQRPLGKNKLIANADKALYLAKRNGRNRVMLYKQGGK